MAFDAHKNLAVATVATPPSPPTSGSGVGVNASEGGRFPAVPFNATVWPAAQPPTPVNAEVVRVTAIAGDTLTITRAQEGTTARSIVAGDLIAATITAKTLTDVESGTNFPTIQTPSLVFTANAVIRRNTADGADSGFLQLAGGGAGAAGRGSFVSVVGNEAGGALDLGLGDVPAAKLTFYTGATVARGVIHTSGGFSWGSAFDPGAGFFSVNSAGSGVGLAHITLSPGIMQLSNTGAANNTVAAFYNANGNVGYIQTTASSTVYSTTSDARLKTDLGVMRTAAAGDVLRQTVIHEFTWKVDGTAGRGVFAQEAVAIAPFAVTVGTDETDDDGRLLQPWGVDYARYVPDLIVGWQHHDASVAALTAANAALSARLTALETAAAAGPSLVAALADWIRARVQRWRTPAPIPVPG